MFKCTESWRLFSFFHNFISRYSSYITWQMTFEVIGCSWFLLLFQSLIRALVVSAVVPAYVFSFIFGVNRRFGFLWPFFFGHSVNIATLFVSNDGVNCIVFTFHVNKVDHNTSQFQHVCNESCFPCTVVQAIHFKLLFVRSFFRSSK